MIVRQPRRFVQWCSAAHGRSLAGVMRALASGSRPLQQRVICCKGTVRGAGTALVSSPPPPLFEDGRGSPSTAAIAALRTSFESLRMSGRRLRPGDANVRDALRDADEEPVAQLTVVRRA